MIVYMIRLDAGPASGPASNLIICAMRLSREVGGTGVALAGILRGSGHF
jgi:hypothetical protein